MSRTTLSRLSHSSQSSLETFLAAPQACKNGQKASCHFWEEGHRSDSLTLERDFHRLNARVETLVARVHTVKSLQKSIKSSKGEGEGFTHGSLMKRRLREETSALLFFFPLPVQVQVPLFNSSLICCARCHHRDAAVL